MLISHRRDPDIQFTMAYFVPDPYVYPMEGTSSRWWLVRTTQIQRLSHHLILSATSVCLVLHSSSRRKAVLEYQGRRVNFEEQCLDA